MIGLGKAFEGMMRGDMAAQQSNQQQQRSDEDAEKFDMLKTQFDQSQQQYAQQQIFSAIYDAKEYGDFSGLQHVGKQYADLMGGEASFRKTNPDDYFVRQGIDEFEQGALEFSPQVRNNFIAQTGGQLSDDPNEALQQIRDTITMTVDGKDSFVSPEQLAIGAGPGYSAFAEQKNLAFKKMKADMLGKKEKVEDLDRLAGLQARVDADGGTHNLSATDQSVYKQLNAKQGMTEETATTNIAEGQYSDAVKQARSKHSVKDADVASALKDQYLSGNAYKDQSILDKEIANYSNMQRVSTELDDLLKEEVASGVVTSKSADFTKYASKEEFNQMKESEQQAVYNKVIRDSKVGTFISNYLKNLSGAAVTEEEYVRVLKSMTGGNIDHVNDNVLVAAFETATREVGEAAQQSLDGVSEMYPGTILEGQRHMNTGRAGVSSKMKTGKDYSTSGGTKTMGETGASAATSMTKEALGNIGTILENLSPEEKKEAEEEGFFNWLNRKIGIRTELNQPGKSTTKKTGTSADADLYEY